jgi:hypothetical protein
MPNKAVSQKQYRFFRAVEGGYAHASGLSPEKAKEMIGHQSRKGLPESKPPRRGLKHVRLTGKK